MRVTVSPSPDCSAADEPCIEVIVPSKRTPETPPGTLDDGPNWERCFGRIRGVESDMMCNKNCVDPLDFNVDRAATTCAIFAQYC